ncbi:MAG: hypothetical protein ACRDIY_00335, partial [Chloroflexota bacterium]
ANADPPALALRATPADPGSSATSSALIAIFEGKDPEEGAAALASLDDGSPPGLVSRLRDLPGEQLPEFLSRLGRDNPDYRGFVEWLAPQGAWLDATLAELRRLPAARGPG